VETHGGIGCSPLGHFDGSPRAVSGGGHRVATTRTERPVIAATLVSNPYDFARTRAGQRVLGFDAYAVARMPPDGCDAVIGWVARRRCRALLRPTVSQNRSASDWTGFRLARLGSRIWP
jgi:hypothetical protein